MPVLLMAMSGVRSQVDGYELWYGDNSASPLIKQGLRGCDKVEWKFLEVRAD
jgi:hypothetical protein